MFNYYFKPAIADFPAEANVLDIPSVSIQLVRLEHKQTKQILIPTKEQNPKIRFELWKIKYFQPQQAPGLDQMLPQKGQGIFKQPLTKIFTESQEMGYVTHA